MNTNCERHTERTHTLHKHTWKDGAANDIPIVIKYKHRSNKDVDLIYAIDNVRANDHKGSAKCWCQSFTPPEIQTPNPTYAIRKCTIPPSKHHTHISDKPNSSNRETEEMSGKKTQRKLENELAYLMKYHVWSSLIRIPNSCARSSVIMSIKSSNFWLPLRWNSLTLMVHVSPPNSVPRTTFQCELVVPLVFVVFLCVKGRNCINYLALRSQKCSLLFSRRYRQKKTRHRPIVASAMRGEKMLGLLVHTTIWCGLNG